MLRKSLLLLPLLASLSACEVGTSDTPAPVVEGREETQGIRNTREIGVSGDAIADRIDSSLDAGEAHAQRMKEMEEQAQ